METKVVSRAFAGSLPVDSVQALASKNLKNIPSRYIRPEIEFELINHGIADELIEKMKIDTQEFFKFPLEEKMAYAQLPNEIEGYGQTLVRKTFDKYSTELHKVTIYLIKRIAKNLGIDPKMLPSFLRMEHKL
ncbi:hypothetical protein GOBAR_DD18578 [Gossypium barbadense]|nr:hypothetical protein GOBAR_DD18578 [Gossypium barbadense]